MRPTTFVLSALLLIGSTLVAAAAPLTPLDPGTTSPGLVEKAHAWHRYCEWGPFRFHRHIPGVGNVRCRQHRHRRYSRRYDRDYSYRYERRRQRNARRCDAWFHECKARWGKRNWRFHRCMRRNEC